MRKPILGDHFLTLCSFATAWKTKTSCQPILGILPFVPGPPPTKMIGLPFSTSLFLLFSGCLSWCSSTFCCFGGSAVCCGSAFCCFCGSAVCWGWESVLGADGSAFCCFGGSAACCGWESALGADGSAFGCVWCSAVCCGWASTFGVDGSGFCCVWGSAVCWESTFGWAVCCGWVSFGCWWFRFLLRLVLSCVLRLRVSFQCRWFRFLLRMGLSCVLRLRVSFGCRRLLVGLNRGWSCFGFWWCCFTSVLRFFVMFAWMDSVKFRLTIQIGVWRRRSSRCHIWIRCRFQWCQRVVHATLSSNKGVPFDWLILVFELERERCGWKSRVAFLFWHTRERASTMNSTWSSGLWTIKPVINAWKQTKMSFASTYFGVLPRIIEESFVY